MSEIKPIGPGEEMAEVYDIETDEMMLAPKALADRAELLKQAWFASIGEIPAEGPNANLGDPALYARAREAAVDLRAALRPGTTLPEADR